MHCYFSFFLERVKQLTFTAEPYFDFIIHTAVSAIQWLLFSEKKTNLEYILRDVEGNYSLQMT